MAQRRKSNLSLKRARQRKKKTVIRLPLWVTTEAEIFGQLLNEGSVKLPRTKKCFIKTTVKKSVKKPSIKLFTPPKMTPKKSNFVSKDRMSSKRRFVRSPGTLAHESPVLKYSKTPTKSPSAKKLKKVFSRNLFKAERSNSIQKCIDSNDSLFSEGFEDFTGTSTDNHLEVLNEARNEITDMNETKDVMKEMENLLPDVLENLRKAGCEDTILDFFRQVQKNAFPLSNIAFLLWSEVVRWFRASNTSMMRYSDSTKKFWKLGYRTFGGRFIHFMSGYKNIESVIKGEAERGVFLSDQSEINFAVPDLKVLRNFSPYMLPIDDETIKKPGVFKEVMRSMAETMENKSCCVTFDGKKLKKGLSKTNGDINLLGFEKGHSLQEKIWLTDNLKQPINAIQETMADIDESVDIKQLDKEISDMLKTLLMDALREISKEILDIKDTRKKKEYSKEKLIERSSQEETDWKNGKYVYAISALIAFLHDIDVFIEKSLKLIDEILRCICYIQNVDLIKHSSLNLKKSKHYHEIEEQDTESGNRSTRSVKQRTNEWFAKRKEAKITGSTIHSALGLDGLQKQKDHFDKVICGVPEIPKSDSLKSALQYGTDNEVNAVATFVGKVLPTLFPNCTFHEEGYIQIGENQSGQPFMIVSPDGSVRKDKRESSTLAGIELKCPLLEIHRQIPSRYLLQCLSEIEALDVEYLIYLCWRPDLSSVFRVKRNRNLFECAYKLAEKLYGVSDLSRQTKLSQESKELKVLVESVSKSENSVELVGLFPSVKHDPDIENLYESDMFRIRRAKYVLGLLNEVYDQYYELKREPASEAVVFLCCDLDRHWESDSVRCAPVCWFTKGYSLDTSTMREILETVLDDCKASGLHIPAISFDGQWHGIAVRDRKGKPLTQLQLQKDVWKNVESMQKAEILKEIKSLNRSPSWHAETISDENGKEKKMIICSNGGKVLPLISKRVRDKRIKEFKKADPNENKSEDKSIVGDVEHSEKQTNLGEQLAANDIDMNEQPDDSNAQNQISGDNERPDIIHEVTHETDSHSYACEDTDSPKKGWSQSTGERIVHQDNDGTVASLRSQVAIKRKSKGFREENVQVSNQQPVTIGLLKNEVKLSLEDNLPNDRAILAIEKNDAFSILTMIKTDHKCNDRGQWDNKNYQDIIDSLSSPEKLNKLRDLELKLVVRYFKRKINAKTLKESDSKQAKISKLCGLLGIEKIDQTFKNPKAKKTIHAKSLCELAFLVVSRQLKKSDLNIIYAEYIWPKEFEGWRDTAPVNITFPDVNASTELNQEKNALEEEKQTCANFTSQTADKDTWFYFPAFSETREQCEVSCIDSTHLLTRTRRKCCKGGLDGLPNNAWRSIAKSNKTFLSLAMIDAVLEPMSASVALTHFSDTVETELRDNGHLQEAELCHDVRLWWKADDDPGIPAKERISMRMFLRRRLLSYVNFSYFPPPGMYVNGWPTQLWEAIIANIDAKIHLYELSQKHTYNVRAFSSMLGETYFSELTLYDRRGQGTVSAEEFGQFMAASVEKLHIRLDPERAFTYRTARKPVYKLVDKAEEIDDEAVTSKDDEAQEDINNQKYSRLRDHHFDNACRLRIKPRKKEGSIKVERNSIQRGSLGVRWESARRNESKLLETMRLGIDL